MCPPTEPPESPRAAPSRTKVRTGGGLESETPNAAFARMLLREFGVCVVPVTGTSMEPVLRAGDRVRVESVPFEKIRVGDIALIEASPDTLVLHRVMATLPNGIHTRGDNNVSYDPEWSDSRILGVVMPRLRRRPTRGRLRVARARRAIARRWTTLVEITMRTRSIAR